MTRDQAIEVGQDAAARFGKAFVVYRFPMWPEDIYSVIAADRGLPAQALTYDRLEPAPATAADRPVDLFGAR
jgi:hypothetical protein